MKKTLFLIVLTFSITNLVQAQVSALPSKFNTGDMVFVVKTGPSLNGITGSGVDDMKTSWADAKANGDFKNTFGWTASVGMYAPLSKLYLSTLFSLGMRGYETSVSWKEGASKINSQKTKLTAFNAQILPLNLGYVINLNSTSALDLHVGPFVSIDFAGSLKSDIEYSNKTSEHSSENINDLEGYKKYDVGLNGGISLWYKRYEIELNYQRGLTPMYDGENDFFSKSIQLNIGYAF